MFVAGGEFLQTQGGDKNPYNQDNPTTRLNWDLLELNQEHFEFAWKAVAFRKGHPSLDRSHFWREDIKWYFPIGNVDFDTTSIRWLTFCRGAHSRTWAFT
jgi:isoamylase